MCDIWLLVLHPEFFDWQKRTGPDEFLTLAIKEPCYSRSPAGKLCVRLDHPMRAEFVATYSITEGFSPSDDADCVHEGDRAFFNSDSRHAID